MRVNVLAETCRDQCIAPVAVGAVNLALQPSKISVRELQHGKPNAIESRRVWPHVRGHRKVRTTSLLDQLPDYCSALDWEQRVNSLRYSFGERCHVMPNDNSSATRGR